MRAIGKNRFEEYVKKQLMHLAAEWPACGQK